MPELPEVETVVKLLKPIIVGSKISSCQILNKRMILSSPDTFESEIKDHIITNVTRKGKFIIWHFDNRLVLISHLRMEGKYIECLPNEPLSKYARIIFTLDDGRHICFDDTRQFGIMKTSDEDHYLIEEPISKLGPEPFYITDPLYLYNKYQKIRRPIKEVILDQSIMAGLGNIYADETLYRCRLHPLTPANKLTVNDCENIIQNSIDVLNKAIELGGSTIRSYHAAKGIDGKFQNELLVYGKEGEHCATKGCHARYRKIFVNGRGTTYCPICQRFRNKPLVIGITGKIGSGKSTATAIFKEHGFKTINADEIVKSLYTYEDVQKRVISIFGQDAYSDNQINKMYLTNIINQNSILKKQLENILHQLVRQEITKFIQDNSNEKLLIAEVPLLYESKMDDLVDATLAIDITLENQEANLASRHSDVSKSIELNKSNMFDKYKKYLTFYLRTENKKDVLEDAINKIINSIIN